MQLPEVIVRVEAAEGDLTLFRVKRGDAWIFYCENNGVSMPLSDENRLTEESVDLEEALTHFDVCQWHALHPIAVHPDFHGQVYNAAYLRCQATPSTRDMSDWRRVTVALEVSNAASAAQPLAGAVISISSSLLPGPAPDVQLKLDIVYVLTNPVMPGLIKIGYTTQADAKIRIDQLYTTGVPVPFDLAFACKVGNAVEVERALHTAFAPYRINPKREFFQIDPGQAIAILKLLHTNEATDEVESQPSNVDEVSLLAAEQIKAKRPNMDFIEMNIPVGTTLRSIKDDHTCTVSGSRKVMYSGSEMSLTAATRLMFGISHSVQPSPHWTVNGKVLREIYEETYLVE